MANSLYFYKLESPYTEDVTKNCKLTINEIDSNFLALKDDDIKNAVLDKENEQLILTRNNGETIVADMSALAYDLEVSFEDSLGIQSGATLTIKYDSGRQCKNTTISGLITVDNLNSVLGKDILTKVITDGSLKGEGTLTSPLGLKGTEQTRSISPCNRCD